VAADHISKHSHSIYHHHHRDNGEPNEVVGVTTDHDNENHHGNEVYTDQDDSSDQGNGSTTEGLEHDSVSVSDLDPSHPDYAILMGTKRRAQKSE
jgi:hypothetical protein